MSTSLATMEEVIFVAGRTYVVSAEASLSSSAFFTPTSSAVNSPMPIMTESIHVSIPSGSATAADSSVGPSRSSLDDELEDMEVDLDNLSPEYLEEQKKLYQRHVDNQKSLLLIQQLKREHVDTTLPLSTSPIFHASDARKRKIDETFENLDEAGYMQIRQQVLGDTALVRDVMRNQPAEMDAADFVTFFLKQKKKETDERKAKARR